MKWFARRFENSLWRINEIRRFVDDRSILIVIDDDGPGEASISLYKAGTLIARGRAGDYVVNDGGTFRILSPPAMAALIEKRKQSTGSG